MAFAVPRYCTASKIILPFPGDEVISATKRGITVKLSKLFFAIVLLSFSSVAHAELLRVQDNEGLMDRVDQFLGTTSFEQSYKCGSYAIHLRPKTGQRVRSEVSNCSSDSVVVVTTPGSKSKRDHDKVTRANYELEKGNPVRILVGRLRHLGEDVRGLPRGSYLSLGNFATDKVVLHNGETVEVASVQIAVVRPSGRAVATFQLLSGRGLPAVARPVSISSSQANPSEILRLLEHGEVAPRRGD